MQTTSTNGETYLVLIRCNRIEWDLREMFWDFVLWILMVICINHRCEVRSNNSWRFNRDLLRPWYSCQFSYGFPMIFLWFLLSYQRVHPMFAASPVFPVPPRCPGACGMVSCGRKSQISAARPETCGVAIEVPLREAYLPPGTVE